MTWEMYRKVDSVIRWIVGSIMFVMIVIGLGCESGKNTVPQNGPSEEQAAAKREHLKNIPMQTEGIDMQKSFPLMEQSQPAQPPMPAPEKPITIDVKIEFHLELKR